MASRANSPLGEAGDDPNGQDAKRKTEVRANRFADPTRLRTERRATDGECERGGLAGDAREIFSRVSWRTVPVEKATANPRRREGLTRRKKCQLRGERKAAVLSVKAFHDAQLGPFQAVAGHGVEQREQLAHARDDRLLGVLAGRAQPRGEGADHGVEADGGDGGHVQDRADRRAAAAAGARAAEASRVAVQRRDAHQRADLAAVGPAQLGQLGGQRGAEHGPHAGDGPQAPVQVAEVVVGLDQLADLLVQPFDLPVDGREHRVEAARSASFERVVSRRLDCSVRACSSWRTRPGLTSATGTPASSSASTSGRSRPPVASTTTTVAGAGRASRSAATSRAMPGGSLATVWTGPASASPRATSSVSLATSIPTNSSSSDGGDDVVSAVVMRASLPCECERAGAGVGSGSVGCPGE